MDRDSIIAERELGLVAAQWQDTDNHTRRFALRAAQSAANANIAPSTRMAARRFRVGELTADEFIRVVLHHVYA
jgi:hypothetical protein